VDPEDLGRNLVTLREEQGISLREVSRAAGMSPASLSAIENGHSSPTLASLHKILKALGTSFGDFFGEGEPTEAVPVFFGRKMKSIEDLHRRYVLVFGKRPGMKFEIVHETLNPTESESEWETHDFDVGGTILQGGPMRLEIETRGQWVLRKGDAYYIHAGLRHRATNLGKRPLRQITVYDPPRY
jgi:transcriptional regulator with XRE-family HTH domain